MCVGVYFSSFVAGREKSLYLLKPTGDGRGTDALLPSETLNYGVPFSRSEGKGMYDCEVASCCQYYDFERNSRSAGASLERRSLWCAFL